MKNKRLIARIGAILACLLLVGALVVPTFADEQTPQPSATVHLGSAWEWFKGTLSSTADNDALALLYDRYLGMGSNDFFEKNILISGTVNSMSVDLGYTLDYSATETSIIEGQVTVYMAAFKLVDSNNNVRAYEALDGGYFRYSLYYNVTDGQRLTISFIPSDSNGAKLNIVYRRYVNDGVTSLIRESIHYGGIDYTNNFGELQIAATIVENRYEGAMLSSIVYPLLQCQSGVGAIPYTEVVYSPSAFYSGMDRAYNLGYEDGYRYGYNNGYNDGIESLEAYNEGYNDAVEEIESGDFGRNIIGSIFSAPFDALRSFTLVEWQLAGGMVVTITLATVVSAAVGIALFIWFLKTFAGG